MVKHLNCSHRTHRITINIITFASEAIFWNIKTILFVTYNILLLFYFLLKPTLIILFIFIYFLLNNKLI